MTSSPYNKLIIVVALVCSVAGVGCHKESAPTDTAGQTRVRETPLAPPAADPSAEIRRPREGTPQAHHPPIDCPLRKQGIDPAHLRPFEDVEKYIAFLERKDRAVWQKPDAVIAALGLDGTETVMDLGAGSGYFAFRFAAALPEGKVIAADVEPEMIRHLHHKAMIDKVPNIEARLIDADKPAVPSDVDLVFLCDVLHHVPERPAWLSRIVRAMPAGARLVLIEFKEGKLPEGPPESMKLPRDTLVKLVTDAGLVLTREHSGLLPYQTFLVFTKP